MRLSEVFNVCEKNGIHLSVEKNNLKVVSTRNRISNQVKNLLKDNKDALLSALKEQTSEVKISPVQQKDNIVASHAQRRIWFQTKLEKLTKPFNTYRSVSFNGELSIAALKMAIGTIINRHQILRTVYKDVSGEPQPILLNEYEFDIELKDISHLAESEHDGEIRELSEEIIARRFDLESDLMVRVALIKISENQHTLISVIHHIATDGWSTGLFVRELNQLYNAYLQDQANPLKPLAIQYSDYAAWQKKELSGDKLDDLLAYWTERLDAYPKLHSLPLDRSRPLQFSHKGRVYHQEISQETTNKLTQFCQSVNATPFIVLETVFALLVSRFSNQENVAIGTVVANRTQKEVEPLLGFFINTLALATDFSGDPKFSELLDINRRNILADFDHQQMPFDLLVEDLNPERSLQYHPIVQVMFALENNDYSSLDLADVNYEQHKLEKTNASYDLSLHATLSAKGTSISWGYATDIFDESTIDKLANGFELLLKQILLDKDKKLSELYLLSSTEKKQLSNLTCADKHSENYKLHEKFERQVVATPDNIAVVCNNEKITYKELNNKANQLAHHLREQGVKPNIFVGVMLERSIDLIVSIIAVLKAGGAYIPLDPKHPERRLNYILRDAKIKIMVSQHNLSSTYTRLPNLNVIDLDKFSKTSAFPADQKCDLPNSNLKNSDFAYVIYTSGSTGEPKGVVVEHGSVSKKVSSVAQYYGLNANDKTLLFASVNFDASITQLFAPLLVGGSTIIRPDHMTDPKELLAYLCKNDVSLLHVVPQYLAALLEESKNYNGFWQNTKLRHIVSGGDVIQKGVLDTWLSFDAANSIALHNSYGPTETCITASINTLKTNTDDKQNITQESFGSYLGNPLPDTQFYVVDRHMQLVPEGAIGELLISGSGLASCYLNRPDLSDYHFIRSPFSFNNDERLYRTGDMVCRRKNGRLEFIGRKDNQIKVRGYRIELGEIEHELSSCKGVRSCAVIVKDIEDKEGNITTSSNNDSDKSERLLVAYIETKDSNISQNDLESELSRLIPNYMIPNKFVILDQLPLNCSGKVDRQALRLLNDESSKSISQPSSETEEKLLRIWLDLLDNKSIGVTDNFFQLGGHSLLATRLASKIRNIYNIEFTLKTLFEAPSIQQQAQYIDKIINDNNKKISTENNKPHKIEFLSVATTETPYPLSFAQQRLWFIDQMDNGSPQYNIVKAIEIDGNFKVDIAELAIARTIQRHSSLRTVYNETDSGPVQIIKNNNNFKIRRFDLCKLDKNEKERKLKNYLKAEHQTPFDLAKDLMIRASYIEFDRGGNTTKGVFLVCLHHIAADGWSMGVLIREFCSEYKSILDGRSQSLKPLQLQYADFSIWQRDKSNESRFGRQVKYWQKQLDDIPPTHALPLDYSRPSIKQYDGGIIDSYLEKDVSNVIKKIANDHDVTLFMLLHAAFALLLNRHSNSDDIIIGTPFANRSDEALAPLIGFFVNTLVLRTNTNHRSFREFLQHVKSVNMEAQLNQDIPFEQLVDLCKVERSAQHTPLFQIQFTMNTNDIGSIDLPRVRCNSIKSENVAAKFDLDLKAHDCGEHISFSWVYDKAIFSESHIAQLDRHLHSLLAGIAANAELDIKDLPLLNDDEMNYLVEDFNNTDVRYDNKCLMQNLFEIQAKKQPNAIAVSFGDETISYRELNEKSNRLARHLLLYRSEKNEVLIGVCLDRSIDMIVSMLAILKAGCAYVPLDPTYPNSRITWMLKNSGIQVVVTESSIAERFDHNAIDTICVNERTTSKVIDSYSGDNFDIEHLGITAANLAYIIYTSGSTGNPKGVAIEHHSAVNLISWVNKTFNVNEKDKLLFLTSICFDLSVYDIFGMLAAGGQIVGVTRDQIQEPKALLDVFKKERITFWDSTPATMEQFVTYLEKENGDFSLESLRLVFMSGDWIPVSLPQRICQFFPMAKNISLGGATEGTVWSNYYEIDSDVSKKTSVPYGKPIDNNKFYILDKNKNLVPKGTAGELYIGGVGVAREYFNDTEKTKNAFFEDAFARTAGTTVPRMYKTGDLGRILPDGNMEFLGRVDHQVKIRGFRVELGEIEFNLIQSPEVNGAVVVAKTSVPDKQKYLVAYVVPKDNQEIVKKQFISNLKGQLREQLPDYMVPDTFIILDELPLNTNNKVDRAALPEPDFAALQGEYLPPQDETQRILVEIWSEMLSLDQRNISIDGNFFELGGHSLIAVTMVSKIKSEFCLRDFPVRIIFENPTIKQMSESINILVNQESCQAISKDKIHESSKHYNRVPLTIRQQKFFHGDPAVVDRGRPTAMANCNITYKFFEFSKRLDSDLIKQSIDILVSHHDILRSRFRYDPESETWWNYINESETNFYQNIFSERDICEDNIVEDIAAHCNSQIEEFDFESGNLLKINLYKTSSNKSVLVFSNHHILLDEFSDLTVIKDFISIYSALEARDAPALSDKNEDIKTYTDYLYRCAEDKDFNKEITYWIDQPWDKCGLIAEDLKINGHDSDLSVRMGKNICISNFLPEIRASKVSMYSVVVFAIVSALKDRVDGEYVQIRSMNNGRACFPERDFSSVVGHLIIPALHFVKIPRNITQAAEGLSSVDKDLKLAPRSGIGHAIYHWAEKYGLINTGKKVPKCNEYIRINYHGMQSSIKRKTPSMPREVSLKNKIKKLLVGRNHPAGERDEKLRFAVDIKNNQLDISIGYSKGQFRSSSIQYLLDDIEKTLTGVIKENKYDSVH